MQTVYLKFNIAELGVSVFRLKSRQRLTMFWNVSDYRKQRNSYDNNNREYLKVS